MLQAGATADKLHYRCAAGGLPTAFKYEHTGSRCQKKPIVKRLAL
jgi:hypothetical protein